MLQFIKVLPCKGCGDEIEIVTTDVLPIRILEPMNKCKTCGKVANLTDWYAWTWNAKNLIEEYCEGAEELKSFRKNPEDFTINTLNPRLRSTRNKVIIFIGRDNSHLTFRTSDEDKLEQKM
jgi:hypothetical protein